jgi:hypothetical protein
MIGFLNCSKQFIIHKYNQLSNAKKQQAVKAFRQMVLNRRNPDLDEFEVLDYVGSTPSGSQVH